jgi:hypothetical protein
MTVRADSSSLTPAQRGKFEEDGYLVLEDVGFPDDLLNGVVDDLEGLYEGEGEVRDDGVFYARHRIGEAWKISEHVRRLALDPAILAVVEDLFGRKPLPFQTLNFRRGTQQAIHSDTIHFNSMPAGFLCAAWVALEDMDMDNGPVVFYPGSHRLPEVTLREVGPDADEDEYSHYIAALAERLGLEPHYATIRRGQVFLWAGNLLHGGSRQRDPARTRHSQVTHFFFEGCKYWSPLESKEQTHWRHPIWVTPEPPSGEDSRRVRELVGAAVPRGSTVLVASRGDDEILKIEGCRGWHFPQDAEGVWPGYYPADGGEAVAHLQELQSRGAEYLVLPAAALWWLDHYTELREHLESQCTLVLREADCVIFAL